MAYEEISFDIRNNTNATIPVNIFGSNAALSNSTINATTQYRWDITGFTFTNEDTVQIAYKTNTAVIYDLFTQTVSQTITSVLQALNSLGIGSFWSYTSGGNTYITTYNDNYSFGQLSIFNVSTPQVNYYFNVQNATGGNANIFKNFVNVVLVPNPAQAQGSVSVVAGDIINANATAVTFPTGLNLVVYDNGMAIYGDKLPSVLAYTFFVVAGHTYDIYVFD